MGQPEPQVIRVRRQAEFQVKGSNQMGLRKSDQLSQGRGRDRLVQVRVQVRAHGRERSA